MRRQLFRWQTALFLFLTAGGFLLHAAYGWSGHSALAAAVSAVNESTWEHMKLLFFPLLFFSPVQLCAMGKNYPNFPAAQAVSAVAGLVLIPVLFYTYTGVLGRDLHWADVAIFLIAALVTALLQGRLLWTGSLSAPWQQAAGVLILWGLAVAFLYCTFHPPALPLFRDPVTLLSGVPK